MELPGLQLISHLASPTVKLGHKSKKKKKTFFLLSFYQWNTASLQMAFISMHTWKAAKKGRRINKPSKIFTVLDISSQGQIDGKCLVWGWQPLNDLVTSASVLKFNMHISSSGTCKRFVQGFCRVRHWPIDSSRNYRCSVPPRCAKCRCWRAAHPDEAPAAPLCAGREQIVCYISLLARIFLRLLLFLLKINAFGLQKHFPRWIFPPRKEPQEKDHFIRSKRGAW